MLVTALIGCQGGERGAQQAGGGGGPSPSPSVIAHGATGGPGSYGGPGMGGVDLDGIGPPATQGGGGGGGAGWDKGGHYSPGMSASTSEDPNVNPINKPRR